MLPISRRPGAAGGARPHTARVDPEGLDRLHAAVEAVECADGSAQRGRAASQALVMLVGLERVLVVERDRAIRALRREGWTLHDIAQAVGLTRGRVHQILRAGDPQAAAAHKD